MGVVGEPGVGKSRLVREFINALGDSQALVLETAAIALGNPAPYLPIVELLRAYFHVDVGEEADVIRRKVTDAIHDLDDNLLPVLSALLTLLDVPVLDPAPYQPRSSALLRERLLREFARRNGDPEAGGSPSRPRLTAYRQDALRCARELLGAEVVKLSEVRERSGVVRAGPILRDNYYGWFDRVRTGYYTLSPKGRQELVQWSSALDELTHGTPRSASTHYRSSFRAGRRPTSS